MPEKNKHQPDSIEIIAKYVYRLLIGTISLLIYIGYWIITLFNFIANFLVFALKGVLRSGVTIFHWLFSPLLRVLGLLAGKQKLPKPKFPLATITTTSPLWPRIKYFSFGLFAALASPPLFSNKFFSYFLPTL